MEGRLVVPRWGPGKGRREGGGCVIKMTTDRILEVMETPGVLAVEVDT